MAGTAGRRVVCGRSREEGKTREGGRDGNGCRYLILVQRVSPRDKLNPIRVPPPSLSPGCIIAERARVADDYGSRFSAFAFAKAPP